MSQTFRCDECGQFADQVIELRARGGRVVGPHAHFCGQPCLAKAMSAGTLTGTPAADEPQSDEDKDAVSSLLTKLF